ncbi:MAG: IPT/TIG domain-containing protein [Myxococcales bacterium]|nr:IPT/TIG domain-containing protein [Myxococcales bacterium]
MRHALAGLLLVPLLAGCGDGSTAPRLDGATPAYGPLIGGTRIVLAGAGFDDDARVLIGGREAPLAHAIDDATLEVVIPPSDRPGDAEVVVLGRAGTATAGHLFHYSAPPVIDAVTPDEVVASSSSTRMTVTGAGFVDDGAGEVRILVDGVLAADVEVESDTRLTFAAPPGIPLVRPDVAVVDQRGTGTRPRGFRYRPSGRGGMLLFGRFGEAFATFFDPLDGTTLQIPRAPTAAIFSAIVVDDRGDYWGVDRSRSFGRIDMRTQTLEAPVALGVLLPAMVRVGDQLYAIDRLSRRIGRLDRATGVFTPLGTTVLTCCGSYGLAFDGVTLWFTQRSATGTAINSIDPVTGAVGTPVELTGVPGLHIEEMRWRGGVLYASNTNATLVTIDPSTGAVTTLPVVVERANAMEIIE